MLPSTCSPPPPNAPSPLRSDPFGLGEAALSPAGSLLSAPPPAAELAQDAALSTRVAGHIVDWVFVRLCDYHAAFPRCVRACVRACVHVCVRPRGVRCGAACGRDG